MNHTLAGKAIQGVQHLYREYDKKKTREASEKARTAQSEQIQADAENRKSNILSERRTEYERLQAKKARGEKLTANEEAFLNTVSVDKDGKLVENKAGTQAYMKKLSDPAQLKAMTTEELDQAHAMVSQQQEMQSVELQAAADTFGTANNFEALEKNENTKNEVPDILSSSERGQEFKAKISAAIANKDLAGLSGAMKELSKEQKKISSKKQLLQKSWESASKWSRPWFPYKTWKAGGQYTMSDYDQQIFKIQDASKRIQEAQTKVKTALDTDKTAEKVKDELGGGLGLEELDKKPAEGAAKSGNAEESKQSPAGGTETDKKEPEPAPGEGLESKSTSGNAEQGATPPTPENIASKTTAQVKRTITSVSKFKTNNWTNNSNCNCKKCRNPSGISKRSCSCYNCFC